MSYATLDDLRSQLGSAPTQSPEYRAKMMHKLPEATSVNREAFILTHCAGKRVLEFGASGSLHDRIVAGAAAVLGVDREPSAGIVGFDLDDVTRSALPEMVNPAIIVCGEVLEHLSNPGWFLTRLKRQYPGVPVILSVPNAFTAVGRKWMTKGYENVNADHVAWYSPKTLAVLLERVGYHTGGLFWCGGDGPDAEGLIVVTE